MTDFFAIAVQTAREVFVRKPKIQEDETPEQRHQRIVREEFAAYLDRQEASK